MGAATVGTGLMPEPRSHLNRAFNRSRCRSAPSTALYRGFPVVPHPSLALYRGFIRPSRVLRIFPVIVGAFYFWAVVRGVTVGAARLVNIPAGTLRVCALTGSEQNNLRPHARGYVPII